MIYPFLALFAFSVIWGILFNSLCDKLEKDHSGLYGQLGRPTLLPRTGKLSYPDIDNSSQYAILGFLVRREHRKIGDTSLSVLCDMLLVLLIIFIIGFSALILRPHFPQLTAILT